MLAGDDKKLWFAAKSGRLDAMRSLLASRVSPNVADPVDGITPLMCATSRMQLDSVRLLVDHKADPNRQAVQPGDTALHVAARHGYDSIIRVLLIGGANPWLENVKGEVPADRAIAADHMQAYGMLIQAMSRSEKRRLHTLANDIDKLNCLQLPRPLLDLIVSYLARPLPGLRIGLPLSTSDPT
eukprot:g15529.t1